MDMLNLIDLESVSVPSASADPAMSGVDLEQVMSRKPPIPPKVKQEPPSSPSVTKVTIADIPPPPPASAEKRKEPPTTRVASSKRPATRASQGSKASSSEGQHPIAAPQSYLNMTDVEAMLLSRNLATDLDRENMRRTPHAKRLAMMVNYHHKVGALMESFGGQEEEVERLTAIKDNQAKELVRLRAQVRDQSLALKDRENKIVVVEGRELLLKTQLEHVESTHEEEIARMTAEFYGRESFIRAEGMAAFRDKVLFSAQGQEFLGEMRRGLLASFLRSRAYFVDHLLPTIVAYYAYGFQSAVDQAQSPDFKGEFDRNSPFRTAPPMSGWQGDPDEAADFSWWIQPIRAACEGFLHIPSDEEQLRAVNPLQFSPTIAEEIPPESSKVRDSSSSPPPATED